MAEIRGRFAPTPSGNMHLGNALCYLLVWLSARAQGGGVVLRMEDADLLRMRPSAVEQTFSDLLWLGLRWDEGPAPDARGGEYFQSCRTALYERCFAALRQRGLVYPCFCSRQDVRLAAAPHAGEGGAVYPGTCRGLGEAEIAALSRRRAPAWRLRVGEETLSFTDRLWGEQRFDLARDCGDFPIRRADGVFCYQFITALDDALMGVSEVVRSRDLLASTPWQLYVQRLFSLPSPDYVHIPMLLDADGRRMAKRDFSLSLAEIRRHYTPEEVVGRLGFLAGLQAEPAPCTAEQLLPLFSWDKLPRGDVAVPPALFARCADG